MQLKIQGTIVGADYDDEFFASWIERGLITPSSRVVAAIETAKEPVSVYLNSFGGDVFAGGEILIALQKCLAAGKLEGVEVGAIAASMAANVVAALKAEGAKVTAHANSQLMFHGCYTATEGGAQHHEDVAASLRAINESVIANLNRIGVTECRAWFAEGREKWLGADEARELGIYDEVLEGGADAPAEVKKTAARLAAFASNLTGRKEYKMEIDKTIAAEGEAAPEPKTVETETAPDAPRAPEGEPAHAEAPEAVAQKLADERFAKLQAKHDKMISDLTTTRDLALKDLESAKAEATSLKAEVEKLTASLAEVRDQLAKSEQNREAVVTSALAPAAEMPTMAEGLAKCATPAERSAFLAAGKYRR